jgi:glycosyltransferase involved in cell wall biosynthesis
MRALVFTHMYPTEEHPEFGVFIEQQVKSLRNEGVDVDVLFVNTKGAKWKYPFSVVPYLKKIVRENYDLVHAHYVFAGIIARSQFRFPLILTHHGDEAFFGWQKHLCKGISRLVDKVIVVSKQIKKAIALEDSHIIPCGVDFDLFRPMSQDRSRESLGLPKDRGLVLFVGDYPKRLKRFDLIKEAINRLKAEKQDVDLVLAHKKPYTSIPIYMNACDVLILASEREGSPQVVKEAMACNLPIVSVDVGDVSEVINGVKGCYLCKRNSSDIAEKIAIVLSKGERTDGRNRSMRYEIKKIARRIIDVYEQVLSEKSKEICR